MDQISGRLNNYSTMSLGLRNGIRSRITKHGGKRVENKTNENLDDDEEEFMDIGDDSSFDSNVSVGGKTEIKDRRGVKRKSCVDTAVFEEQLNQLQEQLVSAMIENQALSQQLEKYKAAAKRESVTETNDGQFQKTLRNYRARSWEKRQGTRKEILPVSEPVQETEVEGSETDMKRTSWDSFRDRLVEYLYEIVDDFTEITKPEQPQVEPEPQLAVKTLKANIKRFMTAIKPYTDTFKGLRNLVTWRSPSYTLIVLCIFTYTVIKGWFLQFLVFLAILRITVNYLHFKNFNFKFSYLDPGEPEKENEDVTLGLSDKFNLVLQVATKVQNGLGTGADSLEKIKNLFTWRQYEATRRLFSVLCFLFIASILFPTHVFWTCFGLGLGVKIFIINQIYAKYPRIKKRYDKTSKLWAALPTDAQYNKDFVEGEMNKYIVIPRSVSEQELLLEQSMSESDSDEDESYKSVEFRELFSLPPTECPLTGWIRGRRALLVGRDKSVFNLILRKRGKLYLTYSFLCFARERTPSSRNIVIPLQDITHVERIKVNHRLPGKGMAIRITMSGEDGDKMLVFGAIIGRNETASSIEEAIENVHRCKRKDTSSRGSWSSESSASRIQNFTFGPYYEDSDSLSE